jgi:hypothetical protein
MKLVIIQLKQLLVIQFIWPQRIMKVAGGGAKTIGPPPHRRAYVNDDLHILTATNDANEDITVPDYAFYFLVNGFVQPTITFVRDQWTRLRIMHASNGHDVKLHVDGADCKFYLLGKGKHVAFRICA